MTETQTPNPDCPACAGTGFVPPFMDACDCCKAGFDAKVEATTAIFEKTADEWTGPLTKWASTDPAVGAIINVGNGVQVWTGDEWKPVPTEALTSAEHLAKYGEDLIAAVGDDLRAKGVLPPAAIVNMGVGDLTVIDPKYVAEDAAGLAAAGLADPEGAAANASMVAAAEAGEPPFKPLPKWIVTDDGEGRIVDDLDLTDLVTAMPRAKLATDAQKALLARLIDERDESNPVVAHAAKSLLNLTAKEASGLIETLMRMPVSPGKAIRPNSYDGTCSHCAGPVPAHSGRIEKNTTTGRWATLHLDGDCLTSEQKAALEADRVTEPGIYKNEASFYRVRKSRTSTRLYAELIVLRDDGDVSFRYNSKAMSFLRRSNKLTWQEARDWGVAYGACIACGRSLHDPRSLVQGWGNTCAKNYGWPTVTTTQAEAIIAGVTTWDEVIGV